MLEHVCGKGTFNREEESGEIPEWVWIWESLASKSLTVEAKAEITLKRLPPAVLS